MIDIFEGRVNGLAQGLFMFDNELSYMKHALDAISITKMVKSLFYFILLFYLYLSYQCFQDPKCLWTPHLCGPHMCDGVNPLIEKH